MNSSCDVLGLGAVAIDDLIYVEEYPPPDVKIRVLHRERQCGGLTATALVAASRLGVRCAYAGVLGTDELSGFAVQSLEREGIDLTYLAQRDNAHPVYSTIIVGESRQTRNIFVDFGSATGADSEWPPEDVIRSSSVLFVDHIGVKGMLRAARAARKAGIPIVADLESDESPYFPELLDLIDHPILSWSFARRFTEETTPQDAVKKLWSEGRKVVVVTCGGDGCWYMVESVMNIDTPQYQPAFPVKVADTTGCGDVFHGAYAAALIHGLDVEDRMRFASAAAALKATRRGGQAGIPTRPAVEEFLRVH